MKCVNCTQVGNIQAHLCVFRKKITKLLIFTKKYNFNFLQFFEKQLLNIVNLSMLYIFKLKDIEIYRFCVLKMQWSTDYGDGYLIFKSFNNINCSKIDFKSHYYKQSCILRQYYYLQFSRLLDPLIDFMSVEPLLEDMLPGVDGVPGLPSFD